MILEKFQTIRYTLWKKINP